MGLETFAYTICLKCMVNVRKYHTYYMEHLGRIENIHVLDKSLIPTTFGTCWDLVIIELSSIAV